MRGKIIVIDPGHGGVEEGAIGPTGLKEKEVNLKVAIKLAHLLEKEGAQVYLTRERDVTLSREDRVNFSLEKKADIFLSIHHNATPQLKNLNRTEIYIPFVFDGPSFDLAYLLVKEFKENFQLPVLPPLPAMYRVLQNNVSVSILGEASYITDPEEEKKLKREHRIEEEAQTYFKAIKKYLERGIPRIVEFFIKGKTVFARLSDEDGKGISPHLINLTINGEPLEFEYHPETGTLQSHLPETLKGGTYIIELQARNRGGNSTPKKRILYRQRNMINSFSIVIYPQSGVNPLYLTVGLYDSLGFPVPPGENVRLEAEGGKVLFQEEKTDREGKIRAFIRYGEEGGNLSIISREFEGMVRIEILPRRGISYISGRVLDSPKRLPMEGVEIMYGAKRTRSLKGGYFFFESHPEYLIFRKDGYYERKVFLDKKKNFYEIELNPLFDGVLIGKKVLIDPKGNIDKPGIFMNGMPSSLLNLKLAQTLSKLIKKGGASVKLTRKDMIGIDDFGIVKISIEWEPDIIIFLDHTEDKKGTIYYYERDRKSKTFALNIKKFLSKEIEWDVLEGSQYFIIHPKGTRIFLLLPGGNLSILQIAYLITLGILNNFGYERGVPLIGRVLDREGNPLASVTVEDEEGFGTETDREGKFYLGHLESGKHKLILSVYKKVVEKTIKIPSKKEVKFTI